MPDAKAAPYVRHDVLIPPSRSAIDGTPAGRTDPSVHSDLPLYSKFEDAYGTVVVRNLCMVKWKVKDAPYQCCPLDMRRKMQNQQRVYIAAPKGATVNHAELEWLKDEGHQSNDVMPRSKQVSEGTRWELAADELPLPSLYWPMLGTVEYVDDVPGHMQSIGAKYVRGTTLIMTEAHDHHIGHCLLEVTRAHATMFEHARFALEDAPGDDSTALRVLDLPSQVLLPWHLRGSSVPSLNAALWDAAFAGFNFTEAAVAQSGVAKTAAAGVCPLPAAGAELAEPPAIQYREDFTSTTGETLCLERAVLGTAGWDARNGMAADPRAMSIYSLTRESAHALREQLLAGLGLPMRSWTVEDRRAPGEAGGWTTVILRGNDGVGSTRVVANMDALIEEVKAAGASRVRTVTASGALTASEQAAFWHESAVVISPKGSHTSSMVYGHPGTVFLEIEQYNIEWPLKTFSENLGFEYFKLVGLPVGKSGCTCCDDAAPRWPSAEYDASARACLVDRGCRGPALNDRCTLLDMEQARSVLQAMYHPEKGVAAPAR